MINVGNYTSPMDGLGKASPQQLLLVKYIGLTKTPDLQRKTPITYYINWLADFVNNP